MSKMSQLNEEFWRGWHIGYQAAKDDNAAEPIKHGRWIMKQHLLFNQQLPYCSECDKTGIFKYDFCPHCGAKMDLDEVYNGGNK